MRKLLLVAPQKSEFDQYLTALHMEGFTTIFEEDDRMVRLRLKSEAFAGVLISYQNNWFTCFEVCDDINHISNVPICVLSEYLDGIDAFCIMSKNAMYLPTCILPIYVAMYMKVLTDGYRRLQFTCNQLSSKELEEQEESITIHGVQLIDKLHKVYVKGEEIDCVGYVYDVLRFLMKKSPNICSYEEIYQSVWKETPYGNYEMNVRVIINKLRRLLGQNEETEKYIDNIRKEGYRFS